MNCSFCTRGSSWLSMAFCASLRSAVTSCFGAYKINKTIRQKRENIMHLRSFCEELLGSGCVLLVAEEAVIELVIDLDTRDVKLGGGSNDVGLVDTAKRDSVDLEWTSDKEETRLKLLEEHYTTSTVRSRNKNEDCSRSDGCTKLDAASLLAVRKGSLDGLRVEVAWLLSKSDDTLTTVGSTSDLNLLGRGLLSLLRLHLDLRTVGDRQEKTTVTTLLRLNMARFLYMAERPNRSIPPGRSSLRVSPLPILNA